MMVLCTLRQFRPFHQLGQASFKGDIKATHFIMARAPDMFVLSTLFMLGMIVLSLKFLCMGDSLQTLRNGPKSTRGSNCWLLPTRATSYPVHYQSHQQRKKTRFISQRQALTRGEQLHYSDGQPEAVDPKCLKSKAREVWKYDHIGAYRHA